MIFPSPAGTSLIKLFPPRKSMVNDFPGDGRIDNLFLQCTYGFAEIIIDTVFERQRSSKECQNMNKYLF